MVPEEVTVMMIADEIGAQPEEWHGKCSEIAWAAIRVLGEGQAVYRYGHFLGSVNVSGFWGQRAGAPFQRHAWVELPDGRVFDPTRWSFENAFPYIWIGQPGDEYDVGGNRLRTAMQGDFPEPDGRAQMLLTSRDLAQHLFEISGEALEVLVGLESTRIVPSMNQLFWLANLSPDVLGDFAADFYRLLEANDMAAFIPMDNRALVLGDDDE